MTAVERAHDAEWLHLPECSLLEETIKILQLRASRHWHEVCGLIIDENTVLPVSNISQTPHFKFEMPVAEIDWAIRTFGDERITGVYHSHPSGSPRMSVADQSEIYDLYMAGCPWRYFIVTAACVTEHRWIGTTKG